MDGSSAAILVALVCLLLASAFFSASETAFTSLNRIRMKSMAAAGNKKAQHALDLANRYDKLLSSVLIGNNIVNILTSSLATVFFVSMLGNLGVTVATVITTILVLIIGEITPKTLAAESPEPIAMAVAPILKAVMVVLTPLNALFSAWKRLVLKIFKLGGADNISEEELLTYVEEVREDGTISEKEEDMIRSVIEFDDVQAIDICTPRVDVKAVDVEEDAEVVAELFHKTGFSRLLVYRGSIDSVVGVVLEKDFSYYVTRMNQTLESIIRPALYITKSLKISTLLGELQAKKTHIAVIVDEFGGTTGIVTIEDILEELVGDIWDEHDVIMENIQQTAPDEYRILGGTEADDMFDLFGMDEDCSSCTVGGWVSEQLGRIPQAGDTFQYQGIDVRVAEVNRNRVASVVAKRLPPEEPGEET